ncbi:putative monocarboxylate transporter [Xylariaceae sp. FL0594]|nr:putative monocarboxylate transporter [Xylariaceae sp. FL0594]
MDKASLISSFSETDMASSRDMIQASTSISVFAENVEGSRTAAGTDDSEHKAKPPQIDTGTGMEKPAAVDTEIPDGGYGWAVIAGCATLTFWFGGTTYSWGVMQTALINQGLASASALAFVGSATIASIAAFALVNARLVRLLGARTAGLLGVFLMGIGETAASFNTHSLGGLIGTESILMGVGVSLCFMVSSVTPAQYFKEKRGLGGTGITFAMDAINQKLGVEWTFRIIGLSMLATGLPMAFLIKDRTALPPSSVWVEWSLFKDFRFVALFLCGLIATFPLFVPVFFIPLYAESFGIPSLGGAGLVAAFQFASFIGRLGGGALASYGAGALDTMNLSLFLNAVSMLLIWPFSTSIGPLALFVILNGAANVFGAQRVGVAMGMVATAWTGGYLLGSPIAGYILNATGSHDHVRSYLPSILYAGGLSSVALVLGLMARVTISRRLRYKV